MSRKQRKTTLHQKSFAGLMVLLVLLASLLGIWRPWQHSNDPAALWNENFKFLNLGLDLQGGLRVTLQVDGATPTAEDVKKVKTIIENRIDAIGVAEPLVQTQGNSRVVVELPGLKQDDQERALKLIGETAKMTFHIVQDGVVKSTDQYTLSDLGPALASGDIILNAQSQADGGGRWVVSFTTTPQGSSTLESITAQHIGKAMAIVLDDQVKSVATIQGVLSTNGQITGNFSAEEASNLALVLKSGSLPVPIKVSEIRAIGPTLGADAIQSGAIAAGIGILLVFVTGFLYYGLYFGLVIALGLVFTSVIILGMLGALGATLTLPGIAGLVLTIGAAVDGNVISFERIKEDLRRGKGIKGSIQSGFGHSLATILDVNLSHLLAAFALANYSTGPVKGFAVTLAVGVIASVFSNLIFSKWFLEVLARKRNFSAPMWFPTPNIDFMRPAVAVTVASLAVAALALGVLGSKGLNFGIDFTSGTSFTLTVPQSTQVEEVREKLSMLTQPTGLAEGAVIQKSQNPATGESLLTIKVPELNAQQSRAVSVHMETQNWPVVQVETVGPAVGDELRSSTLKAVGLGLVLILIYVAFRFDVVMGMASVLAVLHDVAIVMGMYALLGMEFTIATVAAILTLIGYSLNDSIIVSDRIRENLRNPQMKNKTVSEVVNLSINQTLSRTVMTSLTTLLPILSLLFFGGPVLKDFALVLVVGMVIGTYSSIYVVSPFIVHFLQKRQQSAKPTRKARA